MCRWTFIFIIFKFATMLCTLLNTNPYMAVQNKKAFLQNVCNIVPSESQSDLYKNIGILLTMKDKLSSLQSPREHIWQIGSFNSHVYVGKERVRVYIWPEITENLKWIDVYPNDNHGGTCHSVLKFLSIYFCQLWRFASSNYHLISFVLHFEGILSSKIIMGRSGYICLSEASFSNLFHLSLSLIS